MLSSGFWAMMRIGFAALIILCVAVACDGTPTSTTTGHDPYPYTTPTPPFEPTPIDGTFARTVTPEVLGPAGGCRRCPPYRLALGDQILGMENGIFRVYHAGSGYMSVGHYEVDGLRVSLFNDPNCPKDRGAYTIADNDEWRSFEPIDDPCAFDRVRERFMSSLPWRQVDPPENIYESSDGVMLLLLDRRFFLDSSGDDTSGRVDMGSSRMTVEVNGCRQKFEWSVADRHLELDIETSKCDSPWATILIGSVWRRVG